MTKDEAQRLMVEFFLNPEPYHYSDDTREERDFWLAKEKGFRRLAALMRADSSQNEPDARHWDQLAEAARVMAEATQ